MAPADYLAAGRSGGRHHVAGEHGQEGAQKVNVRCGGTAAMDSQSEANVGACPPLPRTTC